MPPGARSRPPDGFLSVQDEDKPAAVAVAAALAGLGFELVATEGTARTLRAAGSSSTSSRRSRTRAPTSPPSSTSARRGAATSSSTPRKGAARADGYLIREAALAARVPCITTISGAAAAVHAIANARAESALSLQERIGVEA